MAIRIYKYPLAYPGDPRVIAMPRAAQIRHVAGQHDLPTLWVEVDEEDALTERQFAFLPTGGAVPAGYQYLGTAHCPPFVWHVYEVHAQSFTIN